MRKSVVKIAVIAVIAVMAAISAVCMVGCGVDIGMSGFMDIFEDAKNNTALAKIYFWQENDIAGGTYREVNLLADIDGEGNPLTSEADCYSNYRLHIIEQVDGIKQNDVYVGKSVSKDDSNLKKDCLVGERREGDKIVQYAEPMRLQDFVESTAFEKYRPENILKELFTLTANDFDTSIKQFSAKKKYNLTQVKIGIDKDYINRYATTFKKDSIFAGSTYVSIEIAYGRIAQLVIYRNRQYGTFEVDSEAYNFKIAYVGPNFTVPNYDR